jgi:hypothetical protein
LAKELVQRVSAETAVTAVVTASTHLLDLELDQWMVSRVCVLCLASFAKIEIRARAALETNACDGRLLAAIASDSMVDNCRVDGLTKFEKRVFRRMH